MLQKLPDLHQVPNPLRQHLVLEVQPMQTLGKPPHVGTEESRVPVSPPLSTGTDEPLLPREPCATLKPECLPGGEWKDLLWEKWPEQPCTMPWGSSEPQPPRKRILAI